MPAQLVTRLNDSDRQLAARALDDFVPDSVFDAHAHLFHARHFGRAHRPGFVEAERGYSLSDYQQALARWMPGRRVEGLFFGFPSPDNDRAGENAWLSEQVGPAAAAGNSRALVLAAPQDDAGAVQRLCEGGSFVGIKPYRLYAPVADTREATIESFAAEWMWQLCHEIEGVLMLHIMRAGGITDPHNVETLRRLCMRYPRCRVVLAHVARSFHYRHARDGLWAVADLENVVVDTSAITHAGAFAAALKILGPERVLWGSDFPVSEFRGACFSHGDGFTWVYADDESARELTVFGSYTLVGIESLLCLREACAEGGLTPGQVEGLFRGNALRWLAPHLNR